MPVLPMESGAARASRRTAGSESLHALKWPRSLPTQPAPPLPAYTVDQEYAEVAPESAACRESWYDFAQSFFDLCNVVVVLLLIAVELSTQPRVVSV